jgi:ribosomal protein L5
MSIGQVGNESRLPNLYPTKIEIRFNLKSTTSYRSLFFMNLLLLENLVGQKLVLHQAHTQIPNFNIKRGSIVGASVTMRGNQAIQFFKVFSQSINKLGYLSSLELPRVRNSASNSISFGINKFLFFKSLSVLTEWDDLSFFYQNKIYGIDVVFTFDSVYSTSMHKLVFNANTVLSV